MNGKRAGRVSVVTGAARGIGLAIAEKFGQEGARLACLDVSERRLAPAVDDLKAKGFEVRGYAVDVGSREQVTAAFARVEDEFTAPTAVLVNNAVWTRFQPLAEIDAETAQRMFAVGVHGIIWIMQAAATQMERRGGGAIVNLSSVSASHQAKDFVAYSALKAGVIGLSRAAAVELSPKKVRVNAILPGLVETQLTRSVFEDARARGIESKLGHVTPMKRPGRAGEIAAAAAFLASDDSSYVDGQYLSVDGGVSSTHPYGRIALPK